MQVKILLMAVFCLGLILIQSEATEAKGWRGLVPLHSTRAEVERLLGSPDDARKEHSLVYKTENEVVIVDYAGDKPCGPGILDGWQVPRGTMTSMTVSPRKRLRLSELRVDESRYKKIPDIHRPDVVKYMDDEAGESITVYQGEVQYITYFPAAQDDYLRCPQSTAILPGESGNPSYPVLDSYHDIPLKSELARLDNFALNLQGAPDNKGYIIFYAGRRTPIREAHARAKRAKKHLVNVRGIASKRITVIEGGHREEFTIELYIVPDDRPAPSPSPAKK